MSGALVEAWKVDKDRDVRTLILQKHQQIFGNSDSLLFCSSRPGRPPKRGPVGLSLPASHMANHHPQLKKHRLDADYPYENGHMSGELALIINRFLTADPRW